MFKKMLKNERGLTLIELLAVVVILGIIAAIAVPSIGGVIQKSKEDAAHADAVQVVNAAKVYSLSNDVNADTVFANKTSNNTVTLDDYLDGVGTYKVTIGKANNKNIYTKIKVEKDGITRYYADEAALKSKNHTAVPNGY